MPGHPSLVAFLLYSVSVLGLAAQELPNLRVEPAVNVSPNNAVQPIEAANWLSNSRQTLMNTYSVRARIEQRGQMSTLPFVSRGVYEAGRFPLVRLEMATRLGTLEGRLTEICDGQVLWTAREVRGLPENDKDAADRDESPLPPGTELFVSRRDIDLISNALTDSEQTVEQVLAAELGVGGLPSLLAGLEWAFAYQTSTLENGRLVFTGRWKSEIRQKLAFPEGKRLPSQVEVVVQPDVPVPERVTYYNVDDGELAPILQMQFSEISFGDEIAAERFRYTPPSGVEVTNLTPGVISGIETAGDTSEVEPVPTAERR